MVTYNCMTSGVMYGRLVSGPIPAGALVIGSVSRNCMRTGALVRLPNGNEIEIAAGVVRSLPAYSLVGSRG